MDVDSLLRPLQPILNSGIEGISWVYDSSVSIVAIVIMAVIWHYLKKKNVVPVDKIAYALMLVVAASFGEKLYADAGILPWTFWMQNNTPGGPMIAFLGIILGILYFLGWGTLKIAPYYNRVKFPPGKITQFGMSWVSLLVLLWIVVSFGAQLNRAYDSLFFTKIVDKVEMNSGELAVTAGDYLIKSSTSQDNGR